MKLYPGVGIETHVEVEEDRVPEDLKLVIFRILQEALNNVAKHAQASEASVRISRDGDRVRITVEDERRKLGLVVETAGAVWG